MGMGDSKMTDRVCPDCNGNGTTGEDEDFCDYCDGEGVVGMGVAN